MVLKTRLDQSVRPSTGHGSRPVWWIGQKNSQTRIGLLEPANQTVPFKPSASTIFFSQQPLPHDCPNYYLPLSPTIGQSNVAPLLAPPILPSPSFFPFLIVHLLHFFPDFLFFTSSHYYLRFDRISLYDNTFNGSWFNIHISSKVVILTMFIIVISLSIEHAETFILPIIPKFTIFQPESYNS